MEEEKKETENENSTVLEVINNDNNSTQINIPLEPENKPLEEKEVAQEFVKKSKNPLKKILLGLIIFLFLLIIIGAILYFLGFFKQEEKEIIQETIKETITKETQKQDEYKFDIKEINSKKLNEELSFLTNKNLNQDKKEEQEKLENEKKLIEEQKAKEEEALRIQEEELQKQKATLEEKKLALENEKAELEALKEEALKMKDELLAKQDENKDNENISENTKKVINNTEKKESNNISKVDNTINENNNFLKFINVAKIKGVLYKKYLDKVTKINPNILLCRDDKNRIELYYGPFNNEEERKELLDKLLANKFDQAYELEFTKEEFDKRCNY